LPLVVCQCETHPSEEPINKVVCFFFVPFDAGDGVVAYFEENRRFSFFDRENTHVSVVVAARNEIARFVKGARETFGVGKMVQFVLR
jgi:hypothetical protein